MPTPTNPTIIVALDTRYKKREPGRKFPVRLILTLKRKRVPYPLKLKLTKEEWERVNGTRPRPPYSEWKRECNEAIHKADDIIKDMKVFSWEIFDELYSDKPKASNAVSSSLKSLFTYQINKLKDAAKIGNSLLYGNALSSLEKFRPGSDIFEWSGAGGADLLAEYEAWMLNAANHKNKKPRSITIIALYLRCFRAIFNEAIHYHKICMISDYPFGKRLYSIPEPNNNKRAIPKADIKKIYDYNTNHVLKGHAQNMWVVSYLMNGANFKDIAYLRNRNIIGNQLSYVRAKTASKRKKQSHILVKLTPQLLDVISHYRIDDNPETFLFGKITRLRNDMTPVEQFNRIKQWIKTTNKYLKDIAGELKIPPFTTYHARHSSAQMQKERGESIEAISEMLGHSKIETTRHYLAGLQDKERERMAANLLNFKN